MRYTLLIICTMCLALSGVAQTKVVAHRGFWKTDNSAQNSIASLRKADSIACWGSEFDVYLTADNGMVVHHDRSRDGVSMITDSTSNITSLRLKNGETVPELDAFLAAAQQLKSGMRLVYEIKPLGDERRERLSAALAVDKLIAYGLIDNAVVISFSKAACLEVISLMPTLPVQYLEGDLAPADLKTLGFAGADYEMDVFRTHPEWIEECHQLGLEVNVWTVNKEDDMRYFIGQGVDYITTNEPVLLQQILSVNK